MNILITNGEWKSSLTCMRSFAKAGHSVSLLSFSPFTPHFHSKFCSERIITPKEEQKEEYLKFILDLIRKKKYDLLVPMSYRVVRYFSELRHEILKHVKLILPSEESVAIAGNKHRTYRLAMEIGVPIPGTYFPENLYDVEQLADRIDFPCLAKEPEECGGEGNTFIENREILRSTFQKLESQKKWAVVQNYIIGKSCNFIGVCNNGKILNYFMFESLRRYPEKNGPTVYARSFFHKKLLAHATTLAQKLSWTGPIEFEFFISEDQRCFLIEINPRFPGPLQSAYSCGVDLRLTFVKLAKGENDFLPPKPYKIGFIYRSVFPQEINSCRENNKYIFDFFVNFFRPHTCYDFSLLDPNLFWWQLKQSKWTLFPKDRENSKNIKEI